jgi:hypothetical protein
LRIGKPSTGPANSAGQASPEWEALNPAVMLSLNTQVPEISSDFQMLRKFHQFLVIFPLDISPLNLVNTY